MEKRRAKIRAFDPSRDQMWDESPKTSDTSPKIESLRDVSPKVETLPKDEVAKALGGTRAKGKKWRDKAS